MEQIQYNHPGYYLMYLTFKWYQNNNNMLERSNKINFLVNMKIHWHLWNFWHCRTWNYVHRTFGRGAYCFCGSRRRSLLSTLSWTNGWILTKLAQTHYWEREKQWLYFGDLDLIFKVTPALKFLNFDQKKIVCTLSLEPNNGFWPNFMYYNFGMVRFD